jgi:hypothetical protein
MHSSIVKIAVSLKQLEANVARARAQGKLVDASSIKAGDHYAEANKFINSLSDSDLKNIHAKYPHLLSFASTNVPSMASTSAAVTSVKSLQKSKNVEQRQKARDLLSALNTENKISLNPLTLAKNMGKAHLSNITSRFTRRYTNMFPKTDNESGSKAFNASINPSITSQVRLAINKDLQNKADKNASKIKDLMVNQKGRAYIDPEKDKNIGLLRYMAQPEQDQVNTLIANHELNELNMKKFKHGSNYISTRGHGHNALQGLHDVSTVNTMGKDSTQAQRFVRDMREGEIEDMIKDSPGLEPILRNMRGGEGQRWDRINALAKKIQDENVLHNEKILNAIPRNLWTYDPRVQARLKPTGYAETQALAQIEHDKGGRLNRHMLKHVGNVLDRDLVRATEEQVKQGPQLQNKGVIGKVVEKSKHKEREKLLNRLQTNKTNEPTSTLSRILNKM